MKLTKIKHSQCVWHDLTEIDEKAIAYLRKNFKFHELDLEDCLSKTERPKLDTYQNYIFLVIFLPILNGGGKLISSPVRVFVGPKYVVTLHDNEILPIVNIKESCRLEIEKNYYLGQGSGFLLYEIISQLFQSCFPVLDKIGRSIGEIEEDLFGEDEEQEIKDMLRDTARVRRNVIVFRRIMLPQRSVISSLEKSVTPFMGKNLGTYFGDVVDQTEKIWDMLTSYKELIESLQDTNEALISHRINSVMKILTVFSVILLPLTFITGLYGMNVNLPLGEHPIAFWGIITGMATLVMLMVTFFRRKKWL